MYCYSTMSIPLVVKVLHVASFDSHRLLYFFVFLECHLLAGKGVEDNRVKKINTLSRRRVVGHQK